MGTEKIKSFIADNRWILIASAFFIIWKFFLITLLWHDRIAPPSPDDSYMYILHINSTAECPSLIFCKDALFSLQKYSGFEHLTYRLFFGGIARLFDLDPITTYQISFFIGTVIMLMAIILLATSLSKNKKLVAFSILILSLFNGAGSYHGFFFVVPSFFALLFFFIIISVILKDSRHWKIMLPILIPLSIMSHMLGFYLVMMLPIFFVILIFISKKIDYAILKKVFFCTLIALIFHFGLSTYLQYTSWSNPYGVESMLKEIIAKNKTSADLNIQGTRNNSEKPSHNNNPTIFNVQLASLDKIDSQYSKWIFFNWIGFVIFIFFLIINIVYKQYKLISLYLSSLILTLMGSISPYGERLLLIVWPLTFLLYAYGMWFSYAFFNQWAKDNFLKIILKIIYITGILAFILINIIYSYSWNSYLNKADDVNLKKDFIYYLEQDSQNAKLISYFTASNNITNFILLNFNTIKFKSQDDINSADYYLLEKKDISSASINDNIVLQRLSGANNKISSETIPPIKTIDVTKKLENFTLIKTIGSVEIYKNKNIN